MQYRTDPITIEDSANLSAADPTAPDPITLATEFRRSIVRYHPWRSVATTGLLVMAFMTFYEIVRQHFFPNISIWHSHGATILLTTVAALWTYSIAARNIRSAHEIEAVVENAFDAVVTCDEHAHIVTWNLRATAMFGWSREEAFGKSINDLILPQNLRSYWEQEFKNFQIAGKSPIFNKILESPALHKDGHEFHVEFASSSVPNKRGYGFSVILRDITERRQMERRLATSEAYFKSVIEASSDVVLAVDMKGKIVFAGGSQERIFQYKPEEVQDTLAASYIHPDDLALSTKRLSNIGRDPNLLTEVRIRRKDGTYCECESIGRPVTDAAGKSVIVISIRDITERKRIQREAALLSTVVKASQDAIISFSTEAKITSWNPAAERAYGYSAEEAIGQGIDLFVRPEDLPHGLAATRGVIESGQPASWEEQSRSRDGTEFTSAITVFPILGAAGTVEGVAGIGRDITERKRMEKALIDSREEALAASRAKSEFLSTMSHEIRTPMNAILGMTELLAETELQSDQRHYLEAMSANGNALLNLINSILDLARIESGRLQIEMAEFDLGDLIDQTISTFGVSAHGKGLELAARIAPGVPDRLIGDPLRLRQVLVNLLGNAIKFTEMGQVVLEIDFAPAQAPGVLLFTVTDTGVGIPPDRLQSIFASFTQVDSSTTRKYGGSGLGLAIAQRLVTMMGGQIGVQSEVNHGSKFSFTIHFDLASRVFAPSKQSVLSLVGSRVLVVDDNQINRLIAREMMTSCGADVSEAESGAEALVAAQQACHSGRPFRIILLDMRMPGMDGLEVARRIRDDHLPVEPLILMLSSDDLKPQIERLRELALDAYLVKPITRTEVFQAIRRVMNDSNREGVEPLARRQEPQLANDSTDDRRKRRVLVAEDSPDNRLVIAAYLRKEPYQLDFAENGRVVVERFRAQSYDLVLMDIQMPEMDGLEATRLIRQWECEHDLGHTPIIALTASVLEEDVKKTLAAGCDQHLSKPIKKGILIEALRSATLIRQSGIGLSADAA
jgi:two-component system sensor histidine kinase/response regulator